MSVIKLKGKALHYLYATIGGSERPCQTPQLHLGTLTRACSLRSFSQLGPFLVNALISTKGKLIFWRGYCIIFVLILSLRFLLLLRG